MSLLLKKMSRNQQKKSHKDLMIFKKSFEGGGGW